MAELGFDSLDIIETAESIEAELDVAFDDDDLGKLFNLNDLYDLVWDRLPEKGE